MIQQIIKIILQMVGKLSKRIFNGMVWKKVEIYVAEFSVLTCWEMTINLWNI